MTQAAPAALEAGFAVIYRWRLEPGKENQFRDAWSRMTEWYVGQGALGSRLHRGNDGLWYAYAQWPDAVARERAFLHELADARVLMQDAIAERFPPILLEPVAGRLILPRRE